MVATHNFGSVYLTLRCIEDTFSCRKMTCSYERKKNALSFYWTHDIFCKKKEGKILKPPLSYALS